MKFGSILVCPMFPLRQLPPGEVDVIRRFLFEYIQGIDAKHNGRWRRLWGTIWRAEPGEGIPLFSGQPRDLSFHKRWMAIEGRIFDNQESFRNLDRFRDWLKTGAGFGQYQIVGERLKFVPASISFDDCSNDEMREFTEHALDFLRGERALRRLWCSIRPDDRAEMLEALIANPNNIPEGTSA